MPLSTQEYLTAKPKLEFYIRQREHFVELIRKEKDKKQKEFYRGIAVQSNKIVTGIVSYVLNEETSLEQHILNLEKEYLPDIKEHLIEIESDS